MKQRILAYIMLAMLAAALLTGCIPAGYTKEHKKEIAQAHKDQVIAWFESNRPEVHLKNDIQAYVSGSDLTAALEGSYETGGRRFSYIYDYVNEIMYTNEFYEQAAHKLAVRYCDALNLDIAQTELIKWGHEITLICENDDAKPEKNTPNGQEVGTGSIGYFPSDMSADDIYQATLEGEPYITIHINAFADEYPKYEKAVYSKYANLGSVTYFVPVSFPYEGVVSRRDSDTGSKETYACFKELPNGMYAGYVRDYEVDFEDKVEYTAGDGKNFSVSIPASCTPIIISDKKETLTNYFTNSEGKEVSNEAEAMYVQDCPGMAGCEQVSVYFAAVKQGLYYYTNLRNANNGGTYHYKVK